MMLPLPLLLIFRKCRLIDPPNNTQYSTIVLDSGADAAPLSNVLLNGDNTDVGGDGGNLTGKNSLDPICKLLTPPKPINQSTDGVTGDENGR